MYSNLCVNQYLSSKEKAPKIYMEQRMSVEDNGAIEYYVYTMVTESQALTVDDVSDLVIIPDDRDVIIGDFNCIDKALSILKVVNSIRKDQGITSGDMPSLKTPVWSYEKNAAKVNPRLVA
tara:strand:- start:6 stop:368 length:363 start_codon:yes stop_codon:yes gene_type:complete